MANEFAPTDAQLNFMHVPYQPVSWNINISNYFVWFFIAKAKLILSIQV